MINDIYHYRRRVASVIFLMVSLVLQSFTFAQSGSITGRIYDKDTKQPLIGTNLIVKGTSMGAASDLDGKFLIRNMPAGKHTIVVSYIGYNSDTVDVNIMENRTLEQNFYLQAKALEGKTVVITAQAQGQVSAVQQQLTSNKIVNVVSEARIQELPDFNAAQAIGRLPGVSTLQSSGEANKIVIRGLAPQYNKVAMGDIALSSTGNTRFGVTSQNGVSNSAISQDRSIDLSMVTPYMIKSIEVYKTLTPDMNADAIGGYVNMQLREAPSGLHSDVLWQSGYAQKSNTYNNFRAVASASDRFFNDKLGTYLLLNAEQYDRNADNMNASYSITGADIGLNGYRPVQVQSVILDRHIENRKRYGANLILDYRLPSGSIKSVNIFSRLNSDYQDYKTVLGYSSKNLNFNYSAGNRNTDLAVNSLELKNDFGFMSVDLKAANTYSRNHLPSRPIYQFSQTGGVVGSAPVNTVPESLTGNLAFNSKGGAESTYLKSIGLYSADYKENDQIYKGDFKVPLNFRSSISGYFKFGGEYRYNYHTNNQSTPYATMKAGLSKDTQMMDSIAANFPQLTVDNSTGEFAGTNFTTGDSKLLSSFLNDQFGNIFWVPNPDVLNSLANYLANNPVLNGTPQGGWQNGPYQHLANTYKYIERYYGTYLMAELNLGSNLMVVGGTRYEQVKSLFFAYNMVDQRNPQTQRVYPVTVYPQNHYWLPMVQGKYNLTDWCDIRYSYTQTLARPAYSELTPHYTQDTYGSSVWAGNPNLTPAQAYNHDFEIIFHSNSLGLLSIGGFYKTIKHFTYSTRYRLFDSPPPGLGFDSTGSYTNPPVQTGATLYTFINSPYNAYVKGIETEFQTRFWYLPSPFNGMVFGINYTHIWSSATYPYTDLRNIPDPNNPRRAIQVLFDSTRSGRLVDQPNDIMNAYIGYDFKGFSARLSFLFQGNSVSYVGAYPEQDGFTKNYFRIDASIRQKLPWKGVQVYFDMNNLNNESNMSAQKSIGGFTSEQNYGLTASLGIRYTF